MSADAVVGSRASVLGESVMHQYLIPPPLILLVLRKLGRDAIAMHCGDAVVPIDDDTRKELQEASQSEVYRVYVTRDGLDLINADNADNSSRFAQPAAQPAAQPPQPPQPAAQPPQPAAQPPQPAAQGLSPYPMPPYPMPQPGIWPMMPPQPGMWSMLPPHLMPPHLMPPHLMPPHLMPPPGMWPMSPPGVWPMQQCPPPNGLPQPAKRGKMGTLLCRHDRVGRCNMTADLQDDAHGSYHVLGNNNRVYHKPCDKYPVCDGVRVVDDKVVMCYFGHPTSSELLKVCRGANCSAEGCVHNLEELAAARRLRGAASVSAAEPGSEPGTTPVAEPGTTPVAEPGAEPGTNLVADPIATEPGATAPVASETSSADPKGSANVWDRRPLPRSLWQAKPQNTASTPSGGANSQNSPPPYGIALGDRAAPVPGNNSGNSQGTKTPSKGNQQGSQTRRPNRARNAGQTPF